MQTKAVIFDLDGTLLNTLEDLSAAVNHALSKRGFPLHSVAEYRSMVGHGIRNLMTVALPKDRRGDEALIDAALSDFMSSYTSHIDVHTRPYPGMQELLTRLNDRGVRLAVASNKFQEGTEKLVAEFFPGIPFTAILGNRPGFPLKPDPEVIREALQSSGTTPEDAVMVGDSLTDMATAANGHIRGIAVSWGYRTLEPSENYTLVHSASELERALLAESHPFEPFLPENARTLFLGSFPPQPRRWSMPFYYPNFQNDFWRIAGLVFYGDRERFVLPGQKRFDQAAIESFCMEKGLAFYDTASEVIRLKDNASDKFLEVVRPSDIGEMLRKMPHCTDIVVTGEKAAETIGRSLGCVPPPVGGSVKVTAGGREVSLWRMPSTSRAYPLPLEKKAEAYRRVLTR